MTMKMFAGAAALAALIATPAMAQMQQQQFAGPKQHTADMSGTTQVNRTHRVRFNDRRADFRAGYYDDRRVGYRADFHRDRFAGYRGYDYDYYDGRRSGFWPGEFAAGVVGGAIGTAGAIATAPFRPFTGDSYAYYHGTTTMPSAGYVVRQPYGPQCVPGTLTTINGRQMLCQ